MSATHPGMDETKDVYATEAAVDGGSPSSKVDGGAGAGEKVGLALIEQERVIPRTADRKVTTKWEYWTYTLFFFSGQGVGIGSYGGSLQQALLSLQFPDGTLEWGGKQMTISSVLLDLNGIVFAVQLVCLLMLGPYADYGSWRPWLLIFFQGLVWITTFAMSGLHKASQWSAANALSVIGNVGNNVSNTFYWAAFAGLVRDLPKVTQAEQEVLQGTRSAEEHAELDMLERSTLFNWVNIVGSGTNLVALGIATGVSFKIGSATTSELLKSYQILLGMWGALTVVCTLPWFILEQHRPGQKLPDGTGWLLAGPKQVWQAVKCARHLSQVWIYLMINFNAMDLSGLNLVSYLGGGGGTLFALIIQRRFKISIKVMLVYGAIMTLGPNLWGVIGAYTQRIGFHHEWEFWLASAWNFQTAAFGSYSTTMITELVPAPKVFMFFALFNTVGKTSGFVGPFVTSAIINRSSGNQNLAFWFLFGMGLAGCAVLALVNPSKAKIDAVRFLEREAQDLYSIPVEHEKGRDLVQYAD